MRRVILHIDMNAFFATCEQIANPSLVGKPVVVGGNGRKGIVSTASYEARKFGIHSAMPMFQATRLCKNLVIVPPNFTLYEEYHDKFINIIRNYFSIIEVASIDECYVDASELLLKIRRPLTFVKYLQQEILTKTGLKCSIGVAPNKFLAKMGSDMKKPMGITCIRKRDIEEVLWSLPIQDMFGIGKKTAPKMKELGINTIGDLAKFEDEYLLKSILGKMYYVTLLRANGIDHEEVNGNQGPLKSVGNSTTLEKDSADIDYLKGIIRELATSVTNRAKEASLVGNSISISIKYSNFQVVNRSCKIPTYSNELAMIYSTAVRLFDTNYQTNREVRLLGVTLQDVKPTMEVQIQTSLFDQVHLEASLDRTRKLIEEWNHEVGQKTFMKASDLLKK